MKILSRLFVLSLLLFIASCSDKETVSETDNLFKFKEYISFNTYSNTSVRSDIRVGLVKPLEQFDLTQEVSARDYLCISPKTDGKLIVENGNTLIFQPSEPLKSDTEYTVSVLLHKLYDHIPKDFRTYTFSFRTIAPNFKMNLGQLMSHSKEWQYINASLETSDVVSVDQAKDLISATQSGKNLTLKWPEQAADGTFFNFVIDSIHRKIEDSEILIQWDGKAIDAKNKGERSFMIPGQNNYTIVDIRTHLGQQNHLQINFSDPLMENQNFAGLIAIENAENLRYEVDGNVLNIYPSNRIVGEVLVTVFTGIKNTEGFSLKNDFSELISFEQLKPEIRLISKGVILPNAQTTPIYFEAVNLAKVDVRVIKIFEDNILQFLQENNLNETSSYNVRRVGRRIAKKTVDLQTDGNRIDNNWKAYAVDLSEYFRADPGAIYQVELSFKKSYVTYDCSEVVTDESEEDEDDWSFAADNDTEEDEELREERYWDNEIYRWRNYNYNWQERDNPCHPAYYNEDRVVSTNILGSNLGLIVKKSNNRAYHLFTTNLVTAKPEPGVTVKLYNFQKQLIETRTTGANGFVVYDSEKNAAFAVAQKGMNYAYVKLEDGHALSMSNFDISGKELQRGLKGFIYTDRGVHRPGDSIHLTFVLNDVANPLPKDHPVTLSVTDARGKLVQRTVLNSQAPKSRTNNNFYYFPIATTSTAPTGNWHASISVGGAQFSKTLRVATVKPNRLKMELHFDDKILDASKPIKGTAKALWLHGSPGRNLKITMEATVRENNSAFSQHHGYRFIDPVRTFDEVEVPVMDSKLSAAGSVGFNKKIEVGKNAPGMLTATFLTKVFEGGGDFSIDVFSKDLAPYSHFVGLKSPRPKRYGSFGTDENTTFDVLTVDAQGTPASNRDLKVQVFKIHWRWWWNRGSDNLSSYENASVHRPYKEYTITTNSQGKGTFTLNIPNKDGGRFLIRIKDEKSGHATGQTAYFYEDWWKNPGDKNSESAKMLVFTADKDTYQVGEKATISFPSGSDGNALVSIENGTEVLETHWVATQKGETQATFDITEEMAPNIYVNISLLQPHDQTKNDLPMRLYGVVPLTVEDPTTILKPQINMPKTLRPEEKFTVKVSEQNNKPMTYTLAVVDEGLLDLTRFRTPDIHDAFYSREALGVKTFDLFDYVIGAYATSTENIYAIGGGDEALGAKNRKAERFKPVVKYLGPFELGAGKTASHEIVMPNYIGSVRTMVVAGDNAKSAYGNAEQHTPVKKPLMVLASLPRKISPGETVVLPVTVFAMENKIKNATVSVKVGESLKPKNGTSKTISFSEPGEQIVNFEFDVSAVLDNTNAVQTIEVLASGHGEKARYEVEIDVENPNPISRKTTTVVLDKNASQTIDFQTFGVPGSNSVAIEFSTLPPMDLNKRMDYLKNYPFSCVEQLTSIGFPQLYLADLADISSSKKREAEKIAKEIIDQLGNYQLTNGGMSYWPGEREADDWSTSYAGHFILEAQQKGYAPPISFIGNWLQYQQNTARQWRGSNIPFNSSLNQAYRLYTLALAGKPELAAMNRLRENKNLSNDAKWRLAAAYALAGKQDVANQIAQTANINIFPADHDTYTYGSLFRNRAMALETMVLLDNPNQRNLAEAIAKELSSNTYLSTQETSYGLLAMAKMVKKNGGKSLDLSFTQNEKTNSLKSTHPIAQRELPFSMGKNSVAIKNNKDNVVYVTITQTGKLPLGDELAEQSKLTVKSEFVDGQGKVMNISTLRQGTEIFAKVSVSNTTDYAVNNLALSQIFPSGWEIVNTSFTELGGGASGDARYTDIRDDRVNFFFDLEGRKTRVFTVKLNASYLGRYYLPGAQVEAMYDNSYYARNKGRWSSTSSD